MRNSFLSLFFLCIFFHLHAQDKPSTLSDEYMERTVFDSIHAYTFASQMPSFQGGDDYAFGDYIKRRIIYPKDAKELKIMGTVYVQYIIEKDGRVSNVTVVPGKGVCPSLDKVAVDAIKSSPRWIPGSNNGIPVRVKKIQRITFAL